MKLKFKNQEFQQQAVDAVADLFAGQENRHRTFSVENTGGQLSLVENELGVGNALLIDDATLEANLHAVQKRNNLPLTHEAAERRFCIEMETGTGKTYVYTKTIFELHRRYGFTKFIIVVPSVAIREGVFKSFQLTAEHFALAYDNAPNRYFIYSSAKLSDVRQFATSANIEVMIINIDAFKKSENIINQAQDRLNGESAMRFIQDTHPIVIVDEPQSAVNTARAKEAVASMNPMCVLQYSATHREAVNLLYRLTPVDAYQMGLVKQICVSSNQVEGAFNKPYIRLVSVSNENGFKAKIELDVKGKSGVVRKTVTAKPDADLYLLSGERELYAGLTLTNIDCTPDYESIELSGTELLRLGAAMGDVNENAVKRAQIRRTIETHLEKELRYRGKGIKVLSLFFIDEVKKYRAEDGGKGPYAALFEECYADLLAQPRFAELRGAFPGTAETVHNGYFSQDKKGRYKDTRGDTQDDYDTYNTIMRDKEWLLSFDCPLRFIFSHSALKEGWDNPNVFQVCTLIEQKSTFTCRQKVGRGLRLCVNQDGERIEDRNINLLHVMANESFADFAATLQREIEDETGMRFGVLDIGLFSGLAFTEQITQEKTVDDADAEMLVAFMRTHGYVEEDGSPTALAKAAIIEHTAEVPPQLMEVQDRVRAAIEQNAPVTPETFISAPYIEVIEVEKLVTHEEAEQLIGHFEDKGYISKSGKIKDMMKQALAAGTLDLPAKFEAARARLEGIIQKADQKPAVRDASRDVVVRLNKQALLSPAFLELWERIKQKTAYRVKLDSGALARRCIRELQAMPAIPKARILTQTADLNVQRSGVSYTERALRTSTLEDERHELPNILLVLQEECGIPRVLGRDILLESGRLQDFLNNPQLFIERCVDILQKALRQFEVDGIRYKKLAGEEYYLQEVFDSAELVANLDRNAVAVDPERCVYDHVIYDSSTVEKPFAVALNNDPDVKMFFKIPSRFTIETPLGKYNPDWAVYLEENGAEKLYFVLETKGSASDEDLRLREAMKIRCGEEHFKALENGVRYSIATEWKSVRM